VAFNVGGNKNRHVAEVGTSQADERDVMVTLVEAYENER
jgi:hypothetical protein